MSLQTIIQIGHKIRNELSKEESLQYHRFVKKAPEYSCQTTIHLLSGRCETEL